MLSIKFLVEGSGVFERNKVPVELKILGLAFYIQLSGTYKLYSKPGRVQLLF
jgi:hypothetical protein